MSIELRDYLQGKYGSEKARAFGADQRKAMAGKGQAMGDGSFPIMTAEDMRNAIRLHGNAKDPAAAKAHIIKRAKALGMTAMLPDGWMMGRAKSELEHAFVLHADSGRTIITAPLREVAQINQGFTYLRGRYVEADSPNGNGAMWTTEDLQMGAPTVAGGPLNWLHQERKIIGALVDGELVAGREAANGQDRINNHIVSNAILWNFIFPNEALSVEKASADGAAYFSMECLSKEVACVDTPGRPGCGASFSYGEYDAGRTCAHLKNKTSVRRFVEPYFLGGAVIVPPIQPGWANATLTTTPSRQAAALTERHHLDEHLTTVQAAGMVDALLAWANR